MYEKWLVLVLLAFFFTAAAVPLVSTVASPAPTAQPKGHALRVLPPQSHAYGKTYGEWGAAWWQWAFSFPFGQDPITDLTGQYNMEHQSGPLWFLAGTGGRAITRTVTIPAGKGVFLAIINVLNDYPCPDPSFEPAEGQTLEEFLLEGADFLISHVTELEVELDGVPVNDLFDYRGTSGLFTFTADPSWVASDPCVTGTPQQGVADGYWIMFAPMSVGQHTIHARGKWVIPEWSYTFEPEITYNVTVTATGGPAQPARPSIYRGSDTHVINMVTGEDHYSGHGVATCIGRAEQEGTGFVDLSTMSFSLAGTITTASGDTIFWTADTVMGPDMVLLFAGGTGRFEDAYGELSSWEFTDMEQVVEGDNLIITFNSVATGWIRY
jgi:hypothetical protein